MEKIVPNSTIPYFTLFLPKTKNKKQIKLDWLWITENANGNCEHIDAFNGSMKTTEQKERERKKRYIKKIPIHTQTQIKDKQDQSSSKNRKKMLHPTIWVNLVMSWAIANANHIRIKRKCLHFQLFISFIFHYNLVYKQWVRIHWALSQMPKQHWNGKWYASVLGFIILFVLIGHQCHLLANICTDLFIQF